MKQKLVDNLVVLFIPLAFLGAGTLENGNTTAGVILLGVSLLWVVIGAHVERHMEENESAGRDCQPDTTKA